MTAGFNFISRIRRICGVGQRLAITQGKTIFKIILVPIPRPLWSNSTRRSCLRRRFHISLIIMFIGHEI